MKHVNLPKYGIGCPHIWLEDNNGITLALCLGDVPEGYKQDPKKYPLDTVATYMVYDMHRDYMLNKTWDERIDEIIDMLNHMKSNGKRS